MTDGLPGLGGVWRFFAMLVVVGALVLGIACANVAGLLLARNTVRQKELAMRAALGASRGRLVQQHLVEALCLATLGTATGLVFMLLAMTAIASLPLPLPLPMELDAPLDWRLFGLTLAMVVTATLASGVLPALAASRASLSPALKQRERTYVHRRWTLRGLLVMGQVTLSVGLVVTALLFVRNLSLARTSSPGFDTTNTLVAQVGLVESRYTPETRVAFLQGAVDRVAALPGVDRAAFAFGMPLSVRHGRTSGADITVAGQAGAKPFFAQWAENYVSPGFFETLGIPRRLGRDFTAADTLGTPRVVVVNETFVSRHLGTRSPIGLHVMLPGPGRDDEYEIVGVVADSRHRTIGEAQMAAIYYAYRQRPTDGRIIHVFARTRGNAGRQRPGGGGGDRRARSVGGRGRADGLAIAGICLPAEPSGCRSPRRPRPDRPHARDGRALRDGVLLRDASDPGDRRAYGARRLDASSGAAGRRRCRGARRDRPGHRTGPRGAGHAATHAVPRRRAQPA